MEIQPYEEKGLQLQQLQQFQQGLQGKQWKQGHQLALKYLECKERYEIALIESNKSIEIAKVQSTILIHTEKERSRTVEGRILAGSVFLLGAALSYKTYETTDPIKKFMTTMIDSIKPSLLPNWQRFLLNESQWVVGYAASGLNQCIRLVLLLGVSGKKVSIVLLQVSDEIISLGGITAALFVLFVMIVFSGVLLKLYISDVSITPVSFKTTK